MPDGTSRNPKRGTIKSLAVHLAVVKSKPVDRSAGFGFLMVPETGLEPVRGCPQRFLRRSKEMAGEGLDVTEGIPMLSVKKTLELVADSE